MQSFSFREWFSLFEGYSIDIDKVLSAIPEKELDGVLSRLADDEKKTWARRKFTTQLNLAQSKTNIFSYSEKDAPHDFIEIEPVFQYTELPVTKISSKEVLPSFEGNKVWYGITFRPVKDMRNIFVDITWPKRVAKLEKSISVMEQKVLGIRQKIYPLLSHINDEMGAAIEDEVEKSGGSLDKAADGVRKRGFQVTRDHISQWLAAQSDSKLEQKADEIKRLKQELEKTMGDKPVFSDEASASAFMRAVQLAFLKAIKHPETESSMELQDQIVDIAVNLFHRINPNKYYDMIVYPQSRSAFNLTIAQRLAKLYNAQSVSLNKIETPQINTNDLYLKYGDKAPDALTRLKGQLGYQTGTKSIATVQSGAKQFLGMWDKPSVRNTKYKNKHILLVDDNTNTSATIQTMHHVLRRLGPRKIDAFVPLYIKFHYASIS